MKIPPLVLLLFLISTQLQAVEEPLGYRLEQYDDVVPNTLQGVPPVSALDIAAMQAARDVVIIDVIPEHRKPDFLPEGQLWIPVPHKGIQGALWLPDVGFGVLSKMTETYFQQHLKQVSQGDQSKALVFYCRADCWMSWNAAKRAMSYGYTSVHWFSEGIDDWEFEGFAFEILQAAPGQRQEQ